MTVFGSVRRKLLGIPAPRKVFSRPGFAPEGWPRFAPVIESLAFGYNATLEDSSEAVLVGRLLTVDPTYRVFAYEGAGMGLGALDLLTPWKNRLDAFVHGPGGPHVYTVYVGLGLALARLRRDPERHLDRLDPLLRWGVVDGYGFHGGFFDRPRYLMRLARPTQLSSEGARVFDQGLGRAVWFSDGGVVSRVAERIAGFQQDRHGDLWTGIGMACAFGGGIESAELEHLYELAGEHRDRLRWGAAIAAWARDLADSQAAHTELACRVFVGISGREAAAILRQGRREVAGSASSASLDGWRGHFAAEIAAA